jgi:hypothetical protein
MAALSTRLIRSLHRGLPRDLLRPQPLNLGTALRLPPMHTMENLHHRNITCLVNGGSQGSMYINRHTIPHRPIHLSHTSTLKV